MPKTGTLSASYLILLKCLLHFVSSLGQASHSSFLVIQFDTQNEKNWRLYLIITSRSPWILINYGSGNVCEVPQICDLYPTFIFGLHIALTPFTKLKVLKNYVFRRMVANSHKKTKNTKKTPKKPNALIPPNVCHLFEKQNITAIHFTFTLL